jgi:serine protease Do
VQVGYIRNGQKGETSVTVASRSKLFGKQLGLEEGEQGDESQPQQSKLGITVDNLTPDIAQRLQVPSGKGVVVTDVKPGSFADDVNLSRGDVVLEINKQLVNSTDDFAKVTQNLKSGQDVVFLVRPARAGANAGTVFLGGTLP